MFGAGEGLLSLLDAAQGIISGFRPHQYVSSWTY
jgi:hypothetical protein